MKEIRCDECKEVVMILAKGSKVKPNIYTVHESCPVSRDNSTYDEEFSPNYDADNIMDFLGIKNKGIAL